MLAPVGAIALNTFREAVRDRVLFIMLFFAVGLILFSLVLGKIAPQEQLQLTTNVGLAGISFMTVVLAIFLGVTNLYKEIERKTVYFILPMPLARWQFLAGKFVGMVWVLLVTLVVMGGTLLTAMSWHDEANHAWVLAAGAADVAIVVLLAVALRRRAQLWPALFAVWMALTGLLLAGRAQVNVSLVVQGLSLIMTEALVISSIALLFSSFSTPFLSGVLTFMVFVAGRELTWLDSLAERMNDPTVDGLVELVSVVFPNCYLFVPSVNVLEGRFVITDFPMAPWALVGNAAAYGVVYAAIALGVSGIILWRRDFV